MKRTPLKRKKPLRSGSSFLKRKPMRAVSKKRSTQNRAYLKMKEKFMLLPENTFCRVCVDLGSFPRRLATEIHHIRGREGEMLTDVRFFLPICRPCHDKVESERGWAYEKGYLANRSRKAIEKYEKSELH